MEKQKKSGSRSSTSYIHPLRKRSILLSQKIPTPIKIMFSGIDCTPKPISAAWFKSGRERALNFFEIHTQRSGGSDSGPNSKLVKPDSTVLRVQHDYTTTVLRPKEQPSQVFTNVSTTDLHETDNIFNTADSTVSGTVTDDSLQSTSLPTRDVPQMPEFINLTIHETETDIILDLPSSTVEKGTPEGNIAEEENKYYEYITQGKGKNRKIVNAEVQTVNTLSKTRITEARKAKHINRYSFASIWDMFDTYNEEVVTESDESSESVVSIEAIAIAREEIQWNKLLQNDKFLDALCVMQRILANNVYMEQQKRFRGLSDPSPFRENIEFKYTLLFLWTFGNDDTKGRCVTGMCWNPANRDILAVGYGKFYYDDEQQGMVAIWNIKNPVQPERDYRFSQPVTSIDFSKQDPNFLAIGFYNGNIKVIDISKRAIEVIGIADKEQAQLYEAVWQLCWYTDHDYYKGQEFLAATSQNGRICKFRLNPQSVAMNYNHMMKITTAEGKLKGIETLRKCANKNVSLSRHSPALVYTPHPVNPNIYYIGSAEGVVHKCSKNYYHQHLDLFLAHDSPMYSIEFSPFCTKLFLTCGDDWNMRMWADGIAEPLFEMKKKAYGVQGCAWSPSHSTLIASISGNEIYIWDIQRKTYDCQSTTISPSKARNTLIQFTPDGRCLLVADIDGNVHVFCLEDMPFQAFFQENLLTQSIKRSLITRPDLLNRIEKLGTLSHERKEKHRYGSSRVEKEPSKSKD